MQKSLMPFFSALSGGIAISILALAAHFLPNYLESNLVSAVTTAAEIQLFHSILTVYLFNEFAKSKVIFLASKIIFFGAMVFSISIYALALNSLMMVGALKVFGPITPIGGVLMIIGWFLLATQFYKLSKGKKTKSI